MATHKPHFPDLLFEPAQKLRRWEAALMQLFTDHQYRELRPSLVRRESASSYASTRGEVLCLDTDGAITALRSDFTLSLAELFIARFETPPTRVCYAGPIFRKPTSAWEAAERFEVGCEFTAHSSTNADADAELYALMAKVPDVLGLTDGTLQLAQAALARKPLDQEQITGPMRTQFVHALSVRALHRVAPSLSGSTAQSKLTEHARALLEDNIDASPYRDILDGEVRALRASAKLVSERISSKIAVRIDYASVEGLNFYTGPMFRLWAPHASGELLAGGRYDALYPALGRPWAAAGFCVRLSRLLELHEAHPELFSATTTTENGS